MRRRASVLRGEGARGRAVREVVLERQDAPDSGEAGDGGGPAVRRHEARA